MTLTQILESVEIGKDFDNIEEIMIEFLNENEDMVESLSYFDNKVLTESYTTDDLMMFEAVGFGKTSNALKSETKKLKDNGTILSRKSVIGKLFDEIEKNKQDVISGEITKAIPIARITFITVGSKSKADSGALPAEYQIWGLSSQDLLDFKNDEGAKKAAATKKADGGINIKTTATGSWRTVYADKITTLYSSTHKIFYIVDTEGKHPEIGARIKKYTQAVAKQKVIATDAVIKILNEFGISKKPKVYTEAEYEKRLFNQLTADRSVAAQEAKFAELLDAERKAAGIAPADKYDYKIEVFSFRKGEAVVDGSVSTISMVEAMGETVGMSDKNKKSFTKKWTENYAEIKKAVDAKVTKVNDGFKVNAGWTTARFKG